MDDLAVEIESENLRRFYGYWRSKHDGQLLPGRQDIDPLDFPYALGDVTLVDVARDPLRFRFRLDGTRHVERFGFDMTGKWLDDFPEPEMRRLIFDSYREVVESGRPRRRHRDLVTDGRMFRYEALLLPLARDGRIIDMLISIISFLDMQIPLSAT